MVATASPAGSTLRCFSRAEYDRMISLGFFQHERVELLHGVLVKMSPIGPPHRAVVDRLTRWLVLALSARALVSIRQPFAASDDSEPEPDVSVVPPGDYSATHPDRADLIIEVADSSLEVDRETKGPLYAASGVGEYWIVNLVQRVVEVYSAPVGGRYTQVRRAKGGETLAPRAFPDVAIAVAELLG